MKLRRIEIDDPARLADELPPRRGLGLPEEAVAAARDIIAQVRAGGDAALLELSERLDGVRPESLAVGEEEIDAALGEVEPEFLGAIAEAAGAIAEFHERQLADSWFTTYPTGIVLGQQVTPIERVGIYVPGGRASYPSTVLMNALPALVAGVDEVAMAVPPQPDGAVSPYVLAAASEVGLTEIYRVGGAQAIAAFAYGSETIRAVDKIAGPGNEYVAAAKSLVSGDVAIDMIAGPSEVLVVADETADATFIACDLMAQAEHDPAARAVLVTTDPRVVPAVEAALDGELAGAPRAEVIRAALEAGGLAVIVPDLVTALAAANSVAPEHLELMVSDPLGALTMVRHAGAVFLGRWTPEAVGDYVAGPSHTLPTGGTARFSSVLGVEDFVKRTSVISYTREALAEDAGILDIIAKAEGLDAHARSVAVRLQASGGVAALAETADEGAAGDA